LRIDQADDAENAGDGPHRGADRQAEPELPGIEPVPFPARGSIQLFLDPHDHTDELSGRSEHDADPEISQDLDRIHWSHPRCSWHSLSARLSIDKELSRPVP